MWTSWIQIFPVHFCGNLFFPAFGANWFRCDHRQFLGCGHENRGLVGPGLVTPLPAVPHFTDSAGESMPSWELFGVFVFRMKDCKCVSSGQAWEELNAVLLLRNLALPMGAMWRATQRSSVQPGKGALPETTQSAGTYHRDSKFLAMGWNKICSGGMLGSV